VKGTFELNEIMGCRVLGKKTKVRKDSDYIIIQILVTFNCIIQFPLIKLF